VIHSSHKTKTREILVGWGNVDVVYCTACGSSTTIIGSLDGPCPEFKKPDPKSQKTRAPGWGIA